LAGRGAAQGGRRRSGALHMAAFTFASLMTFARFSTSLDLPRPAVASVEV
jgi:hypothetical protein